MAFTIVSKDGEKTFLDKEVVNISSRDGYDFKLNVNFDFMLTVQFDKNTNKCYLLNQFNNTNFLFKGKTLPQSMEINKVCKLISANSDDFITIKILETTYDTSNLGNNIDENDIKAIYGSNVNPQAKMKIEQAKSEIERARVAIVKDIYADINQLKNKISINSKAGIVLHIALFLASLVCAFGVSNYLTGLPAEDIGNVIQMPTNMKLIFVYSAIVYGIGLILKQGVFLYFQNKLGEDTTVSKTAEKFMIILPCLFYAAVYIINVLYFTTPKTMPVFAILISLFFTATALTLALATGYFKNNSIELRKELNKFEYRPDFEHVIKEYQKWIEIYANNLSKTKVRNIKDKAFMLQLKQLGEIVLGIITAPFLAYGVSNTLAMCFPEAAGWLRISGLRISPVFLVLAMFLIIFAFFSFANGFLANKKMQASNVIKNDGFSNYLAHGVEIYGLEGIKKLDKEMRRYYCIGIVIVIIEFSMNASFFMQEMGGDLSGMLLSAIAALVPTALLIAETFMLSQTQFETFAIEELTDKIDKD